MQDVLPHLSQQRSHHPDEYSDEEEDDWSGESTVSEYIHTHTHTHVYIYI